MLRQKARREIMGYELQIYKGNLRKGESRYSATVPALPCIMAHGETLAELRDSAIKGIALYVDELNGRGQPFAKPRIARVRDRKCT